MRQYIVFVVSLVALLGSLTTVFATRDLRDYQLRGYVDATQTTDLPYRIDRLGVNANLFQYSESELEQQLTWMQEAQVTWIRQFIYWDEFETTEGDFDWQALDLVIEYLEDYPQLHLIPVFMNSPEWARQNNNVTAPPDDPRTIIPFLRAFAERYGEQIDYYQIWDEPNLDDAWGLSDPQPAEYVALLAESYHAIHSADYQATVIAAALAPTTERGGQNIADTLYLQMMYDLNADAYFDAMAAKPYGFTSPPTERTTSFEMINFSRIILLREIMLANDDGEKALWASNWGWNSLHGDWDGQSSIWGEVSDGDRSDYTIAALERAEREWAWLGGMVLHHWQPNMEEDDPQWGFAIIDQDNQPTALWDALVAYNAPQYASNGLYHPQTPFARYSGIWTFGDLGADIGWLETSDSQLAFDFYGTDIALLLRQGDYFAFLYPQIDDVSTNATPNDADGNSYVLLRSEVIGNDGLRRNELNVIPIAHNLNIGEHTLTAVADRGWDRWALAGYAVSSGDLAQPYQQQIQIAWISTFTALIATIIAGYYLPWQSIYDRLRGVTARLNVVAQFGISILTSLALMLSLLMTWGVSEPHLFRRDLVEQGLLVILTGGLLVVKLPLLVAIVSLVIIFWLIYHHIEWGLFLTILYAPFFLFPIELYVYFFPMSELLILITTIAWGLRLLVRWAIERQSANSDYLIQPTAQWQLFDAMMLIWLGLGVIALFGSSQFSIAFTELRTLFIEPFLFYVIFRTLNLDANKLRQFIYIFVAAGIVVSVIGLVQYILGISIITAEEGTRRLASVYGSPNNVGLLLGRVIPFVLAAMLLNYQRTVATIILGILLITLVLTQSVGSLLFGLPIGIITVLIATYGRKAMPSVGIILIVGVVATLGLTQVSARFASLLDLSSGTNFIRLRAWESTLEIISDNPMTGLGLDQFLYVYGGQYVRPDAIADPDLSHPHNILLDFWIRLGLLGVLWLITFMTLFWRQAIKTLIISSGTEKIMVIGVMGAMGATIGHGMIDNSIYVNDLVYIFMLCVAIVAQLSLHNAE